MVSLVVAAAGCAEFEGPTEPGYDLPAFGAFPGVNGKIVFASTRDPDGGILTMDANGTNVQTLTADGSGPVWSADGTRIAFVSTIDGSSEIYVMNADGSARTRITDNAALDAGPTWSPDGSRIAFHSDRASGFQIWVMDANGTSPTALTTVGGNFGPAWSPDGTKIAFTSNRDGNLEIYVMDANGGNQTRLTNDVARDFDPGWSPDGSRIVFTHGGEVDSDIFVMNANGTSPANLTNTPLSADVTAAWSPDGGRIAFVSDRDGNGEIYVMNADGSNETNISNNPAAESLPDWQPIPQAPEVREDVELLILHVSQIAMPKGTAKSFTATLNEVLSAIDAGDTTTACIFLGDFIEKVRAQSGKKISAADANALIDEATAIADELGCNGCYPDLPAPQLVLQSTTVQGDRVEFQLDVPNFAMFPDDLFEQAPDLAPCGLNTSASRTWVDIYDGNGAFLFGFCSLGSASDLNSIWFSTTVAEWPAEAYVVLTDRQCNITYTSNRINLAGIL